MFIVGYESDEDGKRIFKVTKTPKSYDYDREGVLYGEADRDNAPDGIEEFHPVFTAGKLKKGELSYKDNFGRVRYFFTDKEELKKIGYCKKNMLSYIKFPLKSAVLQYLP